jgi:hypoxanthine phosphoribosyltransferase
MSGSTTRPARSGGRLQTEDEGLRRETANESDPVPRFAHPSEREFAGILSFYQLAWQYEPRTFPLEYSPDGRVTESFTPDFYLPELDLYIELTTLKQSLVTKKNRKLRRLRELYPDVNVRLFYNRDFKSLMTKYGLSGLFAEAPTPDSEAISAKK